MATPWCVDEVENAKGADGVAVPETVEGRRRTAKTFCASIKDDMEALLILDVRGNGPSEDGEN